MMRNARTFKYPTTTIWKRNNSSSSRSGERDFSTAELTNRAKNSNLLRLVESYRRHGHRAAKLDPLGLSQRASIPALDPRRYGFSVGSKNIRSDFISPQLPDPLFEPDTKFDTRGILHLIGEPFLTIGEIAQKLEAVYCSGIGYEYTHLPSKQERRFLEIKLESSFDKKIDPATKIRNYNLLQKSQSFDLWLAKKFPLVKRYGLEGGESLMVALATIVDIAGKTGVQDAVLAIPHRGRLNILTQFMDLDLRLLVRKIRGLPTLPNSLPHPTFGDDVLSHLFTTTSFPSNSTSGSLNLHLLPNPSHLETVTPVALGFARALRTYGSSETLSISVHGDAAFNGQGVVYESLNLAALSGYEVGGTIRVIVNNQLGFTTEGPSATSGTNFYATDLAKACAIPIIHVNGDKIDEVARAIEIAVEFRNQFKKDVAIDLVVYRRRGHNELDSPAFTSPLMYKKIESLPSVLSIYEEEMLDDGLIDSEYIETNYKYHIELLDQSLIAADPMNYTVPELEMERGWDKMSWDRPGELEQVETGFDLEKLKEIGSKSVEVESINVHPRLIKTHIKKRITSLESPIPETTIDFSTAEALALGSLMMEGFNVRLSGQDSCRGTFSHRHATLTDQETGQIHTPLQSISPGTFEVVNSPLTEYGVLGFEQGYSYVSPNSLTIWEAQFGDFVNTAQVILDTYTSSAEGKWGFQSALTLLLPHGFALADLRLADSAGPEHSSARVERFLQLSNEPIARSTFSPSMSIVNVTTPASYFSVLRRQMKRDYRQPLVILSPKGILRLPAAASALSELDIGTSFQAVVDDPFISDRESVKRVVFLSGKMYYDLILQRKERKLDDSIAFIRLEEITPFPYSKLQKIIESYSSATSFAWAQEGPENAEFYSFVAPRLSQILPNGSELQYIGRAASAQVASGVSSYFLKEKVEIFEKLFNF